MIRICLMCLTILVAGSLSAGGAFAEAVDKDGNSSTWTFFQKDKAGAAATAGEVVKKLKQQLLEQNAPKTKVSSPASVGYDHGVYVVIFTAYEHKGEARWSHGFGFHKSSQKDAEKAAVANLKKKDKFWKSDYGYDVKEAKSF